MRSPIPFLARGPHAGPLPALLLAAAFAASGCSDKIDPLGPGSLSGRLDANWDVWQAWTDPDYAFDFRWDCFCLAELTAPVRVQVVDHAVTAVTYLDDGTPVDPDYLAVFPTIAQLFLTVEQAIDDDADVILVEFHAEHGYPTSASLDYDAQAADDELAFTVDNVVFTASPTARATDP